jgi:hypothetical protein
MMRWSVRPSEAGEASQTTGGPMIAGSSQVACTSSGAESGVMPLRVAPPGSSRFTSMPVPARSAAMMWESASVAARDGPYGVKPLRRIVVSLTEMLTIFPCPASSMYSTTARATRK